MANFFYVLRLISLWECLPIKIHKAFALSPYRSLEQFTVLATGATCA